MLFENIKLAFTNFTSNKLRTFLSVLGIVIGVGSVITITTIGRSASANIYTQISRAGLETISVYASGQNREVRRFFTEELGDKIKKAVKGIKEVIPINRNNFQLKHRYMTYDGTVMGLSPFFADVYSYEPAEGNFLSEEDNLKRRNVIVLGSEVATELFPEGGAVGNYIRLFRNQSKSFKVIGVMKEKSQGIGMSYNDSSYIPYNTFTQRLQKVANVQLYAIGTKKGADVLAIAEEVEKFLLAETGSEEGYKVFSPSTIAEMSTSITDTLNLFLSGVAAISLIVGGIGIMNIMLASVAERTKEIGIRKALGASPGTIAGQFLTESITLTGVGGLLGILLGTGLSSLGVSLMNWEFVPDFGAFVIAILVSSSVGIFFGLYPAMRASKLDPIEALNYE